MRKRVGPLTIHRSRTYIDERYLWLLELQIGWLHWAIGRLADD